MVVCWNMLELTLPDYIYVRMFDIEHLRIFRLCDSQDGSAQTDEPQHARSALPLRETGVSTTIPRKKNTQHKETNF